MKTRIVLLLATAVAISSCGTGARYANSQQYQDGIYTGRSSVENTLTVATDANDDVMVLATDTRNSQIYLASGDEELFIPESAKVKVVNGSGNTTIIVEDNSPSVDIWLGYSPWDSWRYASWHTYSWYNRPWRYSSWYHRWHYSAWDLYWDLAWDWGWSYPWRYYGRTPLLGRSFQY